MIQQGLRARLDRSTPVIGGAQVTLAFVPSAPPPTLGIAGPHPEIPAAPSSDLSGLTASASEIMT
jgi:hypothetical protein